MIMLKIAEDVSNMSAQAALVTRKSFNRCVADTEQQLVTPVTLFMSIIHLFKL